MWATTTQAPTKDNIQSLTGITKATGLTSDGSKEAYKIHVERAWDTNDKEDFKLECGQGTKKFKWTGLSTSSALQKHDKVGGW